MPRTVAVYRSIPVPINPKVNLIFQPSTKAEKLASSSGLGGGRPLRGRKEKSVSFPAGGSSANSNVRPQTYKEPLTGLFEVEGGFLFSYAFFLGTFSI